jgi:hypothetical protein
MVRFVDLALWRKVLDASCAKELKFLPDVVGQPVVCWFPLMGTDVYMPLRFDPSGFVPGKMGDLNIKYDGSSHFTLFLDIDQLPDLHPVAAQPVKTARPKPEKAAKNLGYDLSKRAPPRECTIKQVIDESRLLPGAKASLLQVLLFSCASHTFGPTSDR